MTDSSGAGLMPEVRALPRFEAGALDLPVGILGTFEVLVRDTRWEPHSHPTHELLWNERGASAATIGARTWTLTPSLGLWIPAGTTHAGWAPSGTWHRAAQFRLGTPGLAEQPVAVRVGPLLRLSLERLQDTGLPAASRELTEAMVRDLLEPAEHPLALDLPRSPLVQPILEALATDPSDRTALETWAMRLDVSPRTISRAFESSTGLGFRPWVARMRAQRAALLLAEGAAIEEIAPAVGYRSPSAFISAFRRATGSTPGRFLER